MLHPVLIVGIPWGKFKNPLSKIENKMVRMQGISDGVVNGPMGFKYGIEYVIQIDIKET